MTKKNPKGAVKRKSPPVDLTLPPGKHCDDYIDSETSPAPLRKFLEFARAPAHGAFLPKPHPQLYADYEGKRVRVTMASRLGDVGITTDFARDMGYDPPRPDQSALELLRRALMLRMRHGAAIECCTICGWSWRRSPTTIRPRSRASLVVDHRVVERVATDGVVDLEAVDCFVDHTHGRIAGTAYGVDTADGTYGDQSRPIAEVDFEIP